MRRLIQPTKWHPCIIFSFIEDVFISRSLTIFYIKSLKELMKNYVIIIWKRAGFRLPLLARGKICHIYCSSCDVFDFIQYHGSPSYSSSYFLPFLSHVSEFGTLNVLMYILSDHCRSIQNKAFLSCPIYSSSWKQDCAPQWLSYLILF